MAVKISALTAITGANVVASDLAILVDISDATMAASGTDKNITIAELLIGLKARDSHRHHPHMSEIKITPQQHAIYTQLVQVVQAANEHVTLFISTILAGEGITQASIKSVTSDCIVYEQGET